MCFVYPCIIASAFSLVSVTLALPVPVKLGRPFFPERIPDEVFHAGARSKPLPPPAPREVKELPGFGTLPERSFAGYLQVNASCGSYLYFWLVESQHDPLKDPIIIWLNGGPGSSSFLGAMLEMGPFLVSNGTVQRNPYSWNRNATYVMIDQPAGVGYSFVEEPACYAPTERIAVDQLYSGVKELFRQLPQYKALPLYVFGESYAGHYVPELATRILDEGKLDLAGIGLGDAWVDPKSLQMTYAEFATSHGLLSSGAGRAQAEELQRECLANYEQVERNSLATPDDWRKLDQKCNEIEAYIVKQAGGVNVYDVRSFVADYDFDALAHYLQNSSVRSALNADPRATFSSSSDTVAYLLEAQEQQSTAHLMPGILAKTRVLVYSGVFDMDCNFLSTDAWLGALDWPGRSAYQVAQFAPWRPEGNEVWGHMIKVQNLTQVRVLGAGHLVPMDQGRSALGMLQAFITDGQAPNLDGSLNQMVNAARAEGQGQVVQADMFV